MKDAVGSVQSVLLLGGTSEIGLDIVRALAADRARRLVLAARDTGAAAAAVPGAEVLELDAVDTGSHAALMERAFAGEGIDVAIVAAGVLTSPEGDQLDEAAHMQAVNGTGAVSLMAEAAKRMRAQGRGTIVLLSSVAADRPRVSNYAYGASKAAADAFARGLSDALQGSGVEVMIVRPGFVRTKMTRAHDAAPGAVDPDAVTRAVVEGLRARRAVVYVPGFLRWVMLLLRLVPGPIFRRLPL
jgi:decaprenylphospho-beta-D-erythro-pentofuranosid-2-ulose 2-reductase